MKHAVGFLSVVFAVSSVAAGQPVEFKAAGLKTAVEMQLHVSTPTPADMLKLTYLVAQGQGITDLTGLECAVNLSILNLGSNSLRNLSSLSGIVNLTRLYLHENLLTDISALAKLKRLQFLTLAYNQIADLAPLAGLTELTELDLASNRVSNLKPQSGLLKLASLDLSANELSDLAAYCLWLPRMQANNPGLELFYDRRPVLAPGDATGDCRANLPDFALLAAAWLAAVPDNATPDFRPDWAIDVHDLAILAGN